MTLAEYLQKGGSRKATMGSVVLTREEYTYYALFQNKKWEFIITVNAYGYTYRLDDDGVLWTMDDQGNYKQPSVFKIDRKKDLDV